MTAIAQRHLVSVADYLTGEESSECRHEYLAGETYAMSGASAKHNLICGNLFAALHRHLAGSPCRAFIANLKVHLRNAGEDYFYYPDVMIACRAEDTASHYREHPCVLVEVMSPTTERIDRREKLFAYQQIETLEEYVLIAQDGKDVVVYRRADGWRPDRPAPDDGLNLKSIGFDLPLAELYEGVEGIVSTTDKQLKTNEAGFTLVEMSIVLLIMGLLLGGGLTVLSTQVAQQKFKDTQRILEDSKEALLGFAAGNGRLPCPASQTSNGRESFCTNATGGCGGVIVPPIPVPTAPAHGRCSNPYNGFLPGATLGLQSVDGYVRDGWGLDQNRLRYAVYSTLGTTIPVANSGPINTVVHPFTGGTSNDMRTATMPLVSARRPMLSICTTSIGITNINSPNATCPAANAITNQAVAVIFSLGANAPVSGNGPRVDEAANLRNDAAFVSHTPIAAGGTGGEFDDMVVWIPLYTLFNRMLQAGRLGNEE